MGSKVIHPKHYNIEGRKECIDEMIDMFGIEHTRAFCLLNVQKYLYRHEQKNGSEDVKKAEAYKQLFLDYGGDPEHIQRIEEEYGMKL